MLEYNLANNYGRTRYCFPYFCDPTESAGSDVIIAVVSKLASRNYNAPPPHILRQA
jgi:hypothetical protein